MVIYSFLSPTGDRREGTEGASRRPGQEEVPGAVRPDGRTVLLPHPEADPPAPRGCALLLRQQRDSPDQRHDGSAIPGT